MRRRDFVALMGAAFAEWSSETHAQSTTKPLRLGWVSQNPRSAPFNVAFERRLRELGYIDGQNINLEFIDTRGDVSRIAAAMKEVVERGIDILLAPGPELSLRSAMAATSTRPIVMVAIDYDPISLGYVKSLASPGDQVTGVYFQQTELVGKRLQILKELMPNLTSATVFWDRFSADQWKATEKIAAEANLGLFGIDLGEQPYNIHALSEFADAGGLISYGANISVLFERAAEYIDRIAKGAKPAELPVEQPTKFELVINLKTAKAIGLTVPPSLLVRADNVIE